MASEDQIFDQEAGRGIFAFFLEILIIVFLHFFFLSHQASRLAYLM